MKHQIITRHRNEPFTLLGNTYEGADDLSRAKKGTEIIQLPGQYRYSIYIDKFGRYVLEWHELFPCFDVYDRMSENRYYRRFMVCETEEEAMRKYIYCMENRVSMRCLDESYQALAPILFADDERPEIKIME